MAIDAVHIDAAVAWVASVVLAEPFGPLLVSRADVRSEPATILKGVLEIRAESGGTAEEALARQVSQPSSDAAVIDDYLHEWVADPGAAQQRSSCLWHIAYDADIDFTSLGLDPQVVRSIQAGIQRFIPSDRWTSLGLGLASEEQRAIAAGVINLIDAARCWSWVVATFSSHVVTVVRDLHGVCDHV